MTILIYLSTLQGIINCLLYKATDSYTVNGSNSSFWIGKQKVLLRASNKMGDIEMYRVYMKGTKMAENEKETKVSLPLT